jgi:hypothetical protein
MDKLQIHFITWPDGKLFEGTQTSIDPKVAINEAILTWLIPQFFKGLDLDLNYSPARNAIWASMERAGFKIHSMAIPSDIAKGLSR